MAKINLQDISLTYPKQVSALREVSLEIESGSFVSLIGPSGSGKSSLLRVIAGISKPQTGQVLFDGRDVTQTKPQERNVSMVFQNFALYPHMTVYQNIAYPLRARGMKKAEAEPIVLRTAELFGLTDLLSRRPSRISGGQRQLTAIARSLVRTPDVFLLDEPFSNLDAETREALRRQIRLAHERLPQTTFVYAAHNQEEAFSLSDQMVYLSKGRVMMQGTPQEFLFAPANLETAAFVGGGRRNLLPAKERKTGKCLLLGILPEAFHRISDGEDETEGSSEGEIIRIGVRSDGLVRTETGVQCAFTFGEDARSQFYASCDAKDWPEAGEPLALAVKQEDVLIFDQDTGKRLLLTPEEVVLPNDYHS